MVDTRAMTSVTVTSKGRVTIPVKVRNQLGLATGDRLVFTLNYETGYYEIVPAKRSVIALKRIIRKPPGSVSIEDINSAIGEEGESAKNVQ